MFVSLQHVPALNEGGCLIGVTTAISVVVKKIITLTAMHLDHVSTAVGFTTNENFFCSNVHSFQMTYPADCDDLLTFNLAD